MGWDVIWDVMFFIVIPCLYTMSILMLGRCDDIDVIAMWCDVYMIWYDSVSRSVVPDSLRPHGLQPSVHEIFQVRILEWVAISFSRGSSQPRNWTQVSCTTGRFFTNWATREAHMIWYVVWNWCDMGCDVYMMWRDVWCLYDEMCDVMFTWCGVMCDVYMMWCDVWCLYDVMWCVMFIWCDMWCLHDVMWCVMFIWCDVWCLYDEMWCVTWYWCAVWRDETWYGLWCVCWCIVKVWREEALYYPSVSLLAILGYDLHKWVSPPPL